MIIHIGDNISLLEKEIIAIIDRQTVLSSKDTKDFIDKLIKEGCLYNNMKENTRTYIITEIKNGRDGKKYRLYTSNINSTSLFKRTSINR